MLTTMKHEFDVLNDLEQDAKIALADACERCDTWRADWLDLEIADIARARKLLRRRRPRGLWRSEAFSDHMALHAHFTNRMRGSDSFTTV